MENPVKYSGELARFLRFDPVSTAQVKEHIPVEELYQLLDIPSPEDVPKAESLEDALIQNGFTRRDALQFVCGYFTKSELLEECQRQEQEQLEDK
jgi:hypothetical protein